MDVDIELPGQPIIGLSSVASSPLLDSAIADAQLKGATITLFIN